MLPSHMTNLKHHLQMLEPLCLPRNQNWVRVPQKKKNCVNKSEVWLHFTKVEPIDLDNPKATCNYCNRMLGCHWRNGTSTMKVHLQNYPTFPLRKPDIPKGQTLLQPSFKKMSEGGSSNSNTNPLGFVKYDLIKIRKLINISSRRSCLFDMWRVMGLEN
jgi:hypothetical protein